MVTRSRIARGLLMMSALAFVNSCTTEKLGQIVLAVQTDVHLPKDIDSIRIEVFNEGVPKFKQDFERLGTEDAPILLPGTLTLIESDEPSNVILIVVSARSGGGEGTLRIVREVVTTVPPDRIVTLQAPLQYLCDDSGKIENDQVTSDCPDPQHTCLAGTCADKTIDSSTLPDYRPEDIFVEGVCIDVAVCFNEGEVVEIDPADCSMAASGGELNYALQTEGDGICGAFGCFVALDAESPLGWQTRADGRVQLPLGVCDQIPDKVVNVVQAPANDACPLKLTSVPTCGPWSAAGEGSTLDGPITLAGGQQQPVSLTVVDDNGLVRLVWTESGTFVGDGAVKSIVSGGGKPVIEAADQIPPRDIVALGTDVWWTAADESQPNSGAVRRSDGMGGLTEPHVGLTLPEGIAVLGGNLYWTEFSPTGSIRRGGINGGSSTLLAPGFYPFRIAAGMEGTQAVVYWTNEGTADSMPPDGSVARIGAGMPEIIADQATPRGLALDEGVALYWTTFVDGGSLMRISLTGTFDANSAQQLATGLSFPNGVVLDENYVYWTNRGDGSVMRLPKSSNGGDTPLTMSTGQLNPGTITVDSEFIYWLNEGNVSESNGQLMRMAKPL